MSRFIKYSQELIEAVKEVYPDLTYLHIIASEGDPILGRYLDDNQTPVTNKAILEAKSLEEVQELARQSQRKEKVYRMWAKEYSRHNSNQY